MFAFSLSLLLFKTPFTFYTLPLRLKRSLYSALSTTLFATSVSFEILPHGDFITKVRGLLHTCRMLHCERDHIVLLRYLIELQQGTSSDAVGICKQRTSGASI